MFGDPGCDDVEEIISSKNPVPQIKENHQESDSSEGEDELARIFDKVLTRKATKQASLEMMEKLDKRFDEEKKTEEEKKIDEPEEKKIRLMKTKSFLIKPSNGPLKLVSNESKSKEN